MNNTRVFYFFKIIKKDKQILITNQMWKHVCCNFTNLEKVFAKLPKKDAWKDSNPIQILHY